MNQALSSLLDRYSLSDERDWENALREIVQELALLGLWRSKFYEHAAFYGGSALRIFHSLPRFSEDLDFSLLSGTNAFDLSPYLEAIRNELTAFGFSFDVERRIKAQPSAIESAFIKGNTLINLIEAGIPKGLSTSLHSQAKLKIKLEVDTDPPSGGDVRVETLLLPIPFQVKLFTLPSLFAGKVHALLCRSWQGRVKGRDFYDFVWYVARDTPINLAHLESRMRQSGHYTDTSPLSMEDLREKLALRFDAVDFNQAAGDVLPFLRDPAEVELWSSDFFKSLIGRLRAEEPV
ncbi:MAG: nucleotidyl transferase AbiEii/AbiGii toxin family protein [Verrucomicrobiota bacterium]